MRSLSSWISYLSYSYTISIASLFYVSHCNSTKSLCARDCTSWFMLTRNLCRDLVGIYGNTIWICLKSFRGVCPTISSIRIILGVIWNVVFRCDNEWTGYHSYSSSISSICGVDGYVPCVACCLPVPYFLQEPSHVL
jgi:hypothetical protein